MRKKYISLMTFYLITGYSVAYSGHIIVVDDEATSKSLVKKRIFFPGKFKLSDTLRENRPIDRQLSFIKSKQQDGTQVQINGDGFNYYCSVLKEEIEKFDKERFVFKVDILTTTPGAYIEYWDGLKEMKSTSHTGNGEWETLAVNFNINVKNARFFMLYPTILPSTNEVLNSSVEIKNLEIIPKNTSAVNIITKKIRDEGFYKNKEREIGLTKIYGDQDDFNLTPAGEISKFYINKGKTPNSHISIEDVYAMTWDELELYHDYIQLLFPLRTKSGNVLNAPIITPQEEQQFKGSTFLKKRMAHSFLLMLDFYGLEMDFNTMEVQKASHFPLRERQYISSENHNYLRITRILHSLKLCGLKELSENFMVCLNKIYLDNKGKISEKTFSIWENASK